MSIAVRRQQVRTVRHRPELLPAEERTRLLPSEPRIAALLRAGDAFVPPPPASGIQLKKDARPSAPMAIPIEPLIPSVACNDDELEPTVLKAPARPMLIVCPSQWSVPRPHAGPQAPSPPQGINELEMLIFIACFLGVLLPALYMLIG